MVRSLLALCDFQIAPNTTPTSDMTQLSSEQGDQEEPQRSYEDLPADFIFVLYSTLPLQDLVAASCTCKQWLRQVP
jgi:hypothetical protein